MNSIYLFTGYEVPVEGEWTNHLFQALIGEILIMKDRPDIDWDDRMRLLINESDRISRLHGMSYTALLRGLFEKIEEVFGGIEDAPDKGLLY